jgi:hypothetical protein
MRRVAAMAAALAAVLVVTAVAFAQQVNTYDVTASTSPTHAGTKSKPVPVKVTFNYNVGEKSGQEPAAVKAYKISFYGIRAVNGDLFPKCTVAQIAAAGKDDSGCPKGALVGTGKVQSHVYNTNDPGTKTPLICNKDLHVWNAGKGKAVLFLFGPASTCNAAPGGQTPIAATYVKGDGGGTALSFSTPPDLLHPVAGLTTAVRSVQSTIKKRTVTKKGVKKGYYESIKCKGKNRPVKVTFTPESGSPVTATAVAPCTK